MSVAPETVAVEALKRWLLAQLPARVSAYNGLANAKLRAIPGPYAIAADSVLNLMASREGTPTAVALTSGTRTAAQVASDITTAAVSGVTAVDDDGTLVLQSTAAPSLGAVVASDTPACVAVHAGNATLHAAFGWDAGGESVVTSALRAPRHKHVRDGWPLRAPDGAAGHFWCIIGDRQTALVDAARHQRDEYLVTLALEVLVPQGSVDGRTRQRINGAVQCIREVLTSTAGRGLGAAADGILLARILSARVAGAPFGFTGANSPNQLFDAASLSVAVRVWAAPVS